MTDIHPPPDPDPPLRAELPPLCPRCQLPVVERQNRIRLADGRDWWHLGCWPESWQTTGGDAA